MGNQHGLPEAQQFLAGGEVAFVHRQAEKQPLHLLYAPYKGEEV